MRISDWSSDVCSSDLGAFPLGRIDTADPNSRNTLSLHAKLLRSGARQVDHPTTDKGTPIVDPNQNCPARFKRRHFHIGRQRERLMSSRNAFRTEMLPIDRKRTRLNSSH